MRLQERGVEIFGLASGGMAQQGTGSRDEGGPDFGTGKSGLECQFPRVRP